MYVYIKVDTNYCGEWDEGVFEFPEGTTEDHIADYASEWANENAMTFGNIDEPEDDDYDENDYREAYCKWKILKGTRQEVEDEYGEIKEP